MIQRYAWRLFRESAMGQHPVTLYHAHRGTKTLPLGKWMKAKQGIVYNPGKKMTGTAFRAGWHVFRTLDDLAKYCSKMDGTYAVCQVLVKGCRPKPRSRSSVMLAKWMRVCDFQWGTRFPLRELVGDR